jgi:SAM-dependent methyltransferase
MSTMTSDPAYSDLDVALLYDILNPWGDGDAFYLDLMIGATAVLDVGCGTGSILKRARLEGHSDRLVGLDPDPAMLAVARQAEGLEWVSGTATDIAWEGIYDLAIMSGNAFQCLVTDEEIAASLAAIHRSLATGGRFAFDTRNPAAQEWLEWDIMAPMEVVDQAGRDLAIDYDVLDVTENVVTLTENTSTPDGRRLRTDRGTLRFVDPEALDQFLTGAGFTIEARFGDWDRTPFVPDSKFMVTIVGKD